MSTGAAPRILQTIETGGPGGAERVMINLVSRLHQDRAHGVSSLLIRSGWLMDRLIETGAPLHQLELKRSIDPFFLRSLVRLIRRERVGLIHSHEFAMTLYGGVAGAITGVPVVSTIHGRSYYPDAPRRVQALRMLSRRSRMVAVSDELRGFLTDSLGVRGVEVIPNGIDVDRYSGGAREATRAELGFGPDDVVIGAVGNLYPVKGHTVLIEAVARLAPAFPTLRIAIAGRGDEESALRTQAKEAGLGDRLHLLGFRDDVPALLSAFDLYTLPSFSEGQSLALMEAMAAGLPIVASRVGGNPELLREGESGLLFDAGDSAGLAEALRRLIDDPELSRRLGAAARIRARKEFGVERMVDRYLALYQTLGFPAGPDPAGATVASHPRRTRE